jgi:transposase
VALKQERRRNKELERELHRKDKALAETAALLVLSKNELGPAVRLWR